MKIVIVGFSLLIAGCLAPPVGVEATNVSQDTPIRVKQNVQDEVDILFMIDNSPSMEAMQAELVSKFPQFLQVFEDRAHPIDGSMPQYADLHIGVVTSDYGAGDVAGGGCDASPGGQRGLLQAKGAAADAACGTPTGVPYIEYAFGSGGDTCNLPGGCTSVSLGAQFTCMASVGAKGCGFEHQLESVYAALQPGANPGFLRPEALLAVVFVTNEDDGSAPPTTDVFDQSKTTEYGAYTTYRQTRYGVACGTPPALTPYASSNGPLSGCEAAPDMLGAEFPVQRYIDFFTTPGALKDDPTNDIVLVGIDAPTDTVETILAQTKTGNGAAPSPAYVPCAAPSDTCVVALQHSCQNQPQPAFFGDPAVRLNTVIAASHLNQLANICGADLSQTPDYSQALTKVADLISSVLKPGCVPAELADPANPDCVVEDVTTGANGMQKQVSILSCAQTNGALPCWRAVVDPQCAPPASPQSISITIDRAMPVQSDTTARVECSTKACPADHPDC